MKAPWQGLCPGAIVYLRLVAEHAHLLLGTDLFDSAAKGCLSLRPAGPASVLWECRGRRGEGVGDRELGAETDRDRQTHGDGDRERNQSYAQTPQPVISFHRRCQADTWSRSARCVAAGPCGQLAGEWKAAPAYLAVLPSVPWPPRPGDLCRSQEGVERRSFSPPPSLPAFSELVFSCRSRQPFSEGGCTVGSRLWARDLVGSGGLVPSYGLLKIWNLTLAWQCFPRSGYPRCTRGCARGLGPARGLSVREAVALLRPLPPGVGLLLPRGLPVPERVSEGPGASCGACPPRGSSVLACTEPSRASLSVSR